MTAEQLTYWICAASNDFLQYTPVNQIFLNSVALFLTYILKSLSISEMKKKSAISHSLTPQSVKILIISYYLMFSSLELVSLLFLNIKGSKKPGMCLQFVFLSLLQIDGWQCLSFRTETIQAYHSYPYLSSMNLTVSSDTTERLLPFTSAPVPNGGSQSNLSVSNAHVHTTVSFIGSHSTIMSVGYERKHREKIQTTCKCFS